MTENVPQYGMEPFENPDNLPLEELKLKVKTDGGIKLVPALSEQWMEDRYFLHYEMPEIYNDDGSETVGAKERWIEIVSYINDDLKWLLTLPFYRFWSNIVYNSSILDTLVSFLQEAPPFYALESFPNIPKMQEYHEELRRNVLIIFTRLVTNKNSPSEYMSSTFLGSLLYDNYIFTVPIIFDLCQLYGRENAKIIERILYSLFRLQPLYHDDLEKSVPCLVEALNNVERRFENHFDESGKAISLSEKNNTIIKITLPILEDMIIYILDISSTISVLLKIYPSLACAFHNEAFMRKIVSLYANTIPQMYKKLEELSYNDECMPKYMELKHRLDVTRIECLCLYRIILYTPIEDILDKAKDVKEDEMREHIEDYFNTLLTNTVAEKEFLIDYNQLYPINRDFESLCNVCPDIDTIKCDYILQIVHATIDIPQTSNVNFSMNKRVNVSEEPIAGPSGIQNNHSIASSVDTNNAATTPSIVRRSAELDSLITEVKDILSDYGEGFIEMCLKHYNYESASVINAILENTLPPHLEDLDRTLPHIPPDPMEASAAVDLALGTQRLNIYDNDEFDIMTHDTIDMSRVHRGKRKDEYQDINELLNDKTDVKKASDIYNKYSIVTDDYDDEYDDTYDGHDVRDTAADSTEMDLKPFTRPRVLLSKAKNESSSENESETNDDNEETQRHNGRDNFVRNPEEIRKKYEQQRQFSQRGRGYYNVGKARGQGQDKNIADSRNQKTTHKASQGNHNRRAGAQYKRKQGMLPF